jgi:hypothetical protein
MGIPNCLHLAFLAVQIRLWPYSLYSRLRERRCEERYNQVSCFLQMDQMMTFVRLKDSYASRYQSEHYGGYIPEYSTFSRLQAAGYMGDQGTDEDEGAQSKVPIYARMLGWMAGILAVRAIFM